MNVVISQSMLFPWVGMLEQIYLADVYVHYDDVQFSKGSFTNRVQIKTSHGLRWMTIPLKNHKFGQKINEVAVKEKSVWVDRHLEFLRQSFIGAPYVGDVLEIVNGIYQKDFDSLGMLARESTLAVARYFDLLAATRAVDVGDLEVPGASSERVLGIVKAVGGDNYITGHGAKKYLNHQLFDDFGISVNYMNYQKSQYPQLHGDFTPYVSSLDLIANCGLDGIANICSQAVYWKEFIDEPK